MRSFHAGFDHFSGGFIGVDVFFVISGYLITSIILPDVKAGTFSFLEFYNRRARRILPALFFVCLACIPFSWLWMLPSEVVDFSQSLIAVNLFSSNVLFWIESGYFSPSSDLKPLLHTWSLAVEEQYYLFYPVLLMLLYRYRRGSIAYFILALSVGSILLAEWASMRYPAAGFYLLPTRAWELGAGAIVALAGDRTAVSRKLCEIASLLGIGAVLFSIFAFDETTRFPGFWALFPVLGTALVILFAGPVTIVGRVLSSRVLVGVGMISYSLYLWHQPVFAFARLRFLGELHEGTYLALCALCIALASATWVLIEKPFRSRIRISAGPALSSAALAVLMLSAFGVAGNMTGGLPKRPSVAAIADIASATLQPNGGLSALCNGSLDAPECRTSETPKIAIWGDSFAMQLVDGFIELSPSVALVQTTKAACGPIFDVAAITGDTTLDAARACVDFNDRVKSYLSSKRSLKAVILASPFRLLCSRRQQDPL